MSSRVIGIIPSIQKEAHAIQCVTIFSSSASGARARESDADERARANARRGNRRYILTKNKGGRAAGSRTSFWSSSAVTGNRGCFVVLSSMRFTTSGVFTSMPSAILFSC